jgi:hypothetical protein
LLALYGTFAGTGPQLCAASAYMDRDHCLLASWLGLEVEPKGIHSWFNWIRDWSVHLIFHTAHTLENICCIHTNSLRK